LPSRETFFARSTSVWLQTERKAESREDELCGAVTKGILAEEIQQEKVE
jgi:hypothetical protein